MPQLDFSNVLTISQVVWMALIFGAFYLLLAQWALPRVGSVLDERAARITADLDTAHLAKAEADEAVREVQAATRRAATESQGAIAAAMARAKADAAEQNRVANEQLDAQLSEAEARIATARNAAMGALRQVATEAAGTMITRLTGRPADEAALRGAVDSALASPAAARS